jgi:hypothetical protein
VADRFAAQPVATGSWTNFIIPKSRQPATDGPVLIGPVQFSPGLFFGP